jgi:hypothetical protein
MLGLGLLSLTMGLSGRYNGTCRHIALAQSLRRVVCPLVVSIGHGGSGSSAGFGCRIGECVQGLLVNSGRYRKDGVG